MGVLATTGAVMLLTVTTKVVEPTLPETSVVEQVTFVDPSGNESPDAGTQLQGKAGATAGRQAAGVESLSELNTFDAKSTTTPAGSVATNTSSPIGPPAALETLGSVTSPATRSTGGWLAGPEAPSAVWIAVSTYVPAAGSGSVVAKVPSAATPTVVEIVRAAVPPLAVIVTVSAPAWAVPVTSTSSDACGTPVGGAVMTGAPGRARTRIDAVRALSAVPPPERELAT